MIKNDYVTRAKKFVAMVYPYIQWCVYPEEYGIAINTFNHDYNRKVRVKNGATRVVLITSDYVIKINYGHSIQQYGGCEQEYKFYKFAEEECMDYLFMPINKFRMFHKMWYVMPRATKMPDIFEDGWATEMVNEEECEWLETYLYDLHNENYCWWHGKLKILDYACVRRI